VGLHRFADAVPHLVVIPVGEVRYPLAADVGRHDDDGVLEIHRAALAVGETAVVEDLEKDVKDLGVGLLDLVEEDDGIGTPADRLGEVAALLVSHVSRRSSDETGHGVLLHEFAHVDAYYGLLVIEEEFREGPRQLRLADTRGAEEEE